MRKAFTVLFLAAATWLPRPLLCQNIPIYGPTFSQNWFGSNAITPPVSAAWSTLGANCSNANTTSPGGAAIMVTGQSATTNTCGESTAASGTFTHVFVFYGTLTASNFSSLLVGFTDGTKYEACGIGEVVGTGIYTTALASTTLAGAVVGANGAVAGLPTVNAPYFFRLRAVSGTSLACDYSPDGVNWINVFNDNATPYLTPSAVFFGANARGATGSPIGILASYQ